MNNFFRVKFALAAKDVGKVFQQIQEYEYVESSDYNNPYYFKNVEFDNGKINHDVDFPYFVLHNNAKLSDFVSTTGFSPHYCIISCKFLNLLKNFKIDDYQTFEIKIKTKNGFHDYFLFYMYAPEREAEFINWEETTFRIKPYMREYETDQIIKFESRQDYTKLRMELFNEKPKQVQEIELTKLKLKEESIDKDMFRFGGVSLAFFVSEALKEEIEKQGITGIRFKEADGLREPYYQPQGV